MKDKILFAEDNNDLRRSTLDILERLTGKRDFNRESTTKVHGEDLVRRIDKTRKTLSEIEIITAKDGEEAIKLIREFAEQIVFVLTDMRMPLANGNQVAREALSREIPVAICSATLEDISPDIKDQLSVTLEKPIDFTKYLDILELVEAQITT
ncbi:hypothetical protein HOE67_04300 [Candidatus Peregrinibacteria bacterium]|jgi:CheY-like chemotaxis protein|nr:hypothetical protein [Candidatus Peregrinibacteria bacterium]MBT4056303.1 hypothetical protein [Candidatus Peregrinibacteria bacterium]